MSVGCTTFWESITVMSAAQHAARLRGSAAAGLYKTCRVRSKFGPFQLKVSFLFVTKTPSSKMEYRKQNLEKSMAQRARV